MTPRTAQLIDSLALSPHPEGGYFRELHRAPGTVATTDGRGNRSALTTICFLLPEGQVSRWHRVASDEVWHHFDGAPLTVWVADDAFTTVRAHVIGPVRDGLSPEFVVPAGAWQAAEPRGAFALVGCVVAPGFEFADFALLSQGSPEGVAAARRHPDAARFV